MHKATVIGNVIHCDGRSYGIESVIGLTLTEDVLSISLRGGVTVIAESDPIQFYNLGDRCPWATKALA